MGARHFTPELGQAAFGTQAWGQYGLPRYVEALFWHIFREIERVYWNRMQTEWAPEGEYDDPGIEGIAVRPYWWGHEDAPEAHLPNFQFEDVAIWWYKHPGRSMSTDVERTPEQWIAWFDRCMEHLAAVDRASRQEHPD